MAVTATAELPVIIAHRGGAALEPQNTLAAFRNALRLGVPVLEFDMNLTADNAIVLSHDTSINSAVCKGKVVFPQIRALRLAEVKRLDCGDGERMPTLDEFLTAVKGSKALLLGETKLAAGVDAFRFTELIYRTLRRHGMVDRFILQSTWYPSLSAMQLRHPMVKVCPLNSRQYKPKYLDFARKMRATYLMLRWDDLATPDQVRELKSAGIVVYSGTANTESDWAKYVELGFDGILTDDPVRLKAFLDRQR